MYVPMGDQETYRSVQFYGDLVEGDVDGATGLVLTVLLYATSHWEGLPCQ